MTLATLGAGETALLHPDQGGAAADDSEEEGWEWGSGERHRGHDVLPIQ